MRIFLIWVSLQVWVFGQTAKVRIGAFNVACGQWGTPEAIGKLLKQYDLDLVGFNEMPKAQPGKTVPVWTQAAGREMSMPYFAEGTISSANHKAPEWQDALHLYEGKYKSIASRTPLTNFQDLALKGSGWAPASVVRAETSVKGVQMAIYSLHIPGSTQAAGSMHEDLAKNVLSKERLKVFVVVGDYNNSPNDPAMLKVEEAAKMRNAWRDLPAIDFAVDATFKCTCPGRIIDHALYSTASGAKAAKGGIIDLGLTLSDHKAIWVEMDIPATPTFLAVDGYGGDRVGTSKRLLPMGKGSSILFRSKGNEMFTTGGRRWPGTLR